MFWPKYVPALESVSGTYFDKKCNMRSRIEVGVGNVVSTKSTKHAEMRSRFVVHISTSVPIRMMRACLQALFYSELLNLNNYAHGISTFPT